MVESKQIIELAEQIVREHHPEQVILFGSYAYGTPNDNSDVDLLVILPFEGQPARKAAHILQTINISPRFSIDLLARTPEQVKQRLEQEDFFMRQVIESGKVLYETAYPFPVQGYPSRVSR